MTEKLKYKVGDKVLIEAKVTERYKGIGDLRDQIEGFDIKVSSKIIMPKPKVTQAVMDWYEKDYPSMEENPIDEVLDRFANTSSIDSDVVRWLFQINTDCDEFELNKRQHAFATLIAYGPEAVEVEKEKRYRVKLKATGQILRKHKDKYFFTADSFDVFPKQELIEAGFGGVFDNEMFEVEEVE